MSGADVSFWILAALAVVCGWRVFRTDSMVRASFLLLVSFVAVGAIAALLAAPYLAPAIVFMMAVEMTVMALFMVMFMMNPAGLNPMNMVHQPRIAAAAGGVTAVAGVVAAFTVDFPAAQRAPSPDVIAALGHELLGPSMLIFESAGAAIVATMLCSVVLSDARGRYGSALEGSRPPGLTPGGPPAGRRPQGEDEQGGEAGHAGGQGSGGHSSEPGGG